MIDAFTLGRVIYEARIRAAWTKASADLRLAANPWPRHLADERAADHDLALASAAAVVTFLKESEA
jgi:hypothetical protein